MRYIQSESSPEHLNDFTLAYIMFSNLYNSALISQDKDYMAYLGEHFIGMVEENFGSGH